MIERNLDYLQFTTMFEEIKCIDEKMDIVAPIKFYGRGYRDSYGARIYFGNPNSKKALVIISGEPLQNMREFGYQDTKILEWSLRNDGIVSRLDLAVTESAEETKQEIIQVADVQEWFKKGLVSSPLCKWGGKMIEGVQVGAENTKETFYIGDPKRRASKGIFRAYDKGIELGMSQGIITRLELELKRDKAHQNAKRIAENGDIAGNFRASFDVKHQEFQRIMQAQIAQVTRGKGKMKKEASEELSKKWDWLIRQVAPALNSAIAEDKSHGLGDARLTQFLIASGLTQEMSQAVEIIASGAYAEKLLRNGLID